MDGKINGDENGLLIFMGIIGLITLGCAIWVLVRALTGGYQKEIRAYIAATADPEGTEQALDRFYEDTMQDGNVRMSRSWLMYVHGGDSWVLAGDDVVWAYQYTLRRKMYGIVTVGTEITVRVFNTASKKNCHDIHVNNADEARKILEDLQRTYPDAMIGYDAELEKRYKADPVAFHKAVIDARHKPAAPAQPVETAAPAQDAPAADDSKPLYT